MPLDTFSHQLNTDGTDMHPSIEALTQYSLLLLAKYLFDASAQVRTLVV